MEISGYMIKAKFKFVAFDKFKVLVLTKDTYNVTIIIIAIFAILSLLSR